MFGQFAELPPAACWGRVDGVVVVPGADDADGDGLAAETTAAAPPTRSSADSDAVKTARLRPGPPRSGAVGSTAGAGCGPAGTSGAGRFEGSCHSKRDLLGSWFMDRWIDGSRSAHGTSGPVGTGDAAWWAGQSIADPCLDRRDAF